MSTWSVCSNINNVLAHTHTHTHTHTTIYTDRQFTMNQGHSFTLLQLLHLTSEHASSVPCWICYVVMPLEHCKTSVNNHSQLTTQMSAHSSETTPYQHDALETWTTFHYTPAQGRVYLERGRESNLPRFLKWGLIDSSHISSNKLNTVLHKVLGCAGKVLKFTQVCVVNGWSQLPLSLKAKLNQTVLTCEFPVLNVYLLV